MKKFIIQSILLLIVIVVALYLSKSNFQASNVPFLPVQSSNAAVTINGAALKVEIADTQQKRSKGLSGKESIATDEGMLFIFEKTDKYPFWMKGLAFPLDFIWIKGETIVDLLSNAPFPAPGQSDTALPIYQPKEDVDKVLEVSAGTIQRLNIKVGDVIGVQ